MVLAEDHREKGKKRQPSATPWGAGWLGLRVQRESWRKSFLPPGGPGDCVFFGEVIVQKGTLLPLASGEGLQTSQAVLLEG